MGALEQITQMRAQGISDEDIMNNLQGAGVSPADINEGFNQASIKSAVGDGNQSQPPQEDVYVPSPQESDSGTDVYSPNVGGEGSAPYQGGQEEFYPQGGMDTSTIIEVAEQVFSEKMRGLQKTLDEVSKFKPLADSKMENVLERVKKLEKMMDLLQVSILQKVGSYGNNLENIKKEMSMMQDSFTKMIPSMAKHHPQTPHALQHTPKAISSHTKKKIIPHKVKLSKKVVKKKK